MPVKRIWRGWTTPQNADTYQRLLDQVVFPGIRAKSIPGYRGVELLRKDGNEEVAFVTVMTFDSIEDVISFQGEDYARSYVPAEAQKVLKRWDDHAMHYESQGFWGTDDPS